MRALALFIHSPLFACLLLPGFDRLLPASICFNRLPPVSIRSDRLLPALIRFDRLPPTLICSDRLFPALIVFDLLLPDFDRFPSLYAKSRNLDFWSLRVLAQSLSENLQNMQTCIRDAYLPKLFFARVKDYFFP